MKYAYLDTDGGWSTAQTAVPEVVSDYQQNTPSTHMSLKACCQPRPGSSTPGSCTGRSPSRSTSRRAKVYPAAALPNGEQVLVNYGPSLRFAARPALQPDAAPAPPDPAIPPQQYAFENRAYQLAHRIQDSMEVLHGLPPPGYLQLTASVAVSGGLTCTPVSPALMTTTTP